MGSDGHPFGGPRSERSPPSSRPRLVAAAAWAAARRSRRARCPLETDDRPRRRRTEPRSTRRSPTAAKAWKRKIAAPDAESNDAARGRRGPALAGSSAAAYRLTPAFNTLSNRRIPLDVGLAQTPHELAESPQADDPRLPTDLRGHGRRISGLNTLSSTTADAGIARVRQGVAMLRRIGHEVSGRRGRSTAARIAPRYPVYDPFCRYSRRAAVDRPNRTCFVAVPAAVRE